MIEFFPSIMGMGVSHPSEREICVVQYTVKREDSMTSFVITVLFLYL